MTPHGYDSHLKKEIDRLPRRPSDDDLAARYDRVLDEYFPCGFCVGGNLAGQKKRRSPEDTSCLCDCGVWGERLRRYGTDVALSVSHGVDVTEAVADEGRRLITSLLQRKNRRLVDDGDSWKVSARHALCAADTSLNDMKIRDPVICVPRFTARDLIDVATGKVSLEGLLDIDLEANDDPAIPLIIIETGHVREPLPSLPSAVDEVISLASKIDATCWLVTPTDWQKCASHDPDIAGRIEAQWQTIKFTSSTPPEIDEHADELLRFD